MVNKHIPIPENLKDRGTYKGVPLPYVSPDQRYEWEGSGNRPFEIQEVFDFRGADPAKVADCYELRLCGLCGGGMGMTIAFLGGPISSESLCYTFPPMHEDCAEYAAKVYPDFAKGVDPAFDPAHSTEPLTECVMVLGTGYQPHPVIPDVIRVLGFTKRRVFKGGEEQGRLL